jgi:hypothetical protein
MKEIKKIFAVILIFSVLLSGCGVNKTSVQNTQENKPASSTETSSDTETSKEKKTAVLYTYMGYSNETAEFKKHSYQYSGELTAEVLGEGLSELTGLDFLFTNTSKSDGIVIDWNVNSSLFGKADMKKASRFFGDDWPDGPYIDWFMLDSLWETLIKNLGVENVYYTMNGGKELKIDGLMKGTVLVDEFPSDIPYMGSGFCSVHTDGNGRFCKDFNQNTAMDLVGLAANHYVDKKASVIVQIGEETIEGEHAFTYSAGENSADGQKYTALYHYAVTDSGKIYYMDVLQGADWILFEW